MPATEAIWALLAATLLGFLIGLERERKRESQGSIFAGVRTFPLISLFGAISGLLSEVLGVLPLVAGLLAIAGHTLLAYWRESSGVKIGGTTEVAALVAFGLGALAGRGQFSVALAGAVVTTGVLSLREELRRLVGALSREDLFAIVQFAAVTLVILPIVPNRTFGPWEVWNPRTIWLLVVLISGVSFVGYLAVKVIGTRRGIGLSGLLGGLASSTAVTLSFSRRSREQPDLGRPLAIGVLAASAIAAPRLLVLLGVVRPNLVLPALAPLIALFAITSLGGWLLARRPVGPTSEQLDVPNPFELWTAVQFAALFALILVLAKGAEVVLGSGGVYLASGLAGLTQLDAITLSLASQVQQGLDPLVATRGLALAVAANCLFKASLAVTLGRAVFGRAVLTTLLIAGAVTVATAWFLLPALLRVAGSS